jgi:hypothetical protein
MRSRVEDVCSVVVTITRLLGDTSPGDCLRTRFQLLMLRNGHRNA